jgi:hypothetical protein
MNAVRLTMKRVSDLYDTAQVGRLAESNGMNSRVGSY